MLPAVLCPVFCTLVDARLGRSSERFFVLFTACLRMHGWAGVWNMLAPAEWIHRSHGAIHCHDSLVI